MIKVKQMKNTSKGSYQIIHPKLIGGFAYSCDKIRYSRNQGRIYTQKYNHLKFLRKRKKIISRTKYMSKTRFILFIKINYDFFSLFILKYSQSGIL